MIFELKDYIFRKFESKRASMSSKDLLNKPEIWNL